MAEPPERCLQVMTLEPTNWKARIYAGRSLHDARRHPEAFEVFRSAIELEPANWEGHNMLGNSIMNSQNHSLLVGPAPLRDPSSGHQAAVATR